MARGLNFWHVRLPFTLIFYVCLIVGIVYLMAIENSGFRDGIGFLRITISVTMAVLPLSPLPVTLKAPAYVLESP